MRTWIVALTAGALGFPVPAAGQAEASATERAEAHKREGFARFREGRYEEGIFEMERAYRLVPHPGFLLNIAVASDRWDGHCHDSLIAFQRFFEVCKGTCAMHDAATARHSKVTARCRASVRIDTVPPGATLDLDGRAMGAAPLIRDLPVGAHVVIARAPGHEEVRRPFRVSEGLAVELRLELPVAGVTLAPPAAPPPKPTLEVTAIPPDDGGPGALPWVAVGAGAAGLTLGVIYTFQTLSALDAEEAARAERNTKAEVTRLQDEARSKALIANIGYGAGVVGIGTGLLLWWLDGDDTAPVTLSVGARDLRVAGRF